MVACAKSDIAFGAGQCLGQIGIRPKFSFRDWGEYEVSCLFVIIVLTAYSRGGVRLLEDQEHEVEER